MQQDVLGLDVAVDHAVAVGVVERARHLARDPDRVRHRELLLPREPVAERLPFHEGHDVEEKLGDWAIGRFGDWTAGDPRIEQGQDVRVLQRGGGADLGEEPLGADHRGQLGAEHLDRHLAVVPQVLGQVHRGHPAMPQLPLDAVAVGKGAGEPGGDGDHRVKMQRLAPGREYGGPRRTQGPTRLM